MSCRAATLILVTSARADTAVSTAHTTDRRASAFSSRASRLLHVPVQPAVGGLRDVHDAVAVDRDPFAPAPLGRIDGFGVWHAVPHLAVGLGADPNPALDGRI